MKHGKMKEVLEKDICVRSLWNYFSVLRKKLNVKKTTVEKAVKQFEPIKKRHFEMKYLLHICHSSTQNDFK